ncbi:MAG TPA: prolipoprotein diacylglyceryl transferase family protein [Acidimicrobiales bacterium]|nr:prolipoprotein diacylglyceryl transferase family protein [Acidimicrobiales bacterium]
MKPIPVSFHIGPLLVHTYGIGLAITFWFAYRYFDHRLRKNGYETRWLTGVFLWVVVASIVGARALHVLSDLSYYSSNPGEILAIWHGGLSSFGGLLGGVPTGVLLARRRCPELGVVRALDLVSPVLMAAWGIGRLLGPQLMVAGGGARTSAWYGMYYAGEQGKRVPVPIIQSIDSFVIFGILLLLERRYHDRPAGFVLAATAGLWGLGRFYEEFVFLRQSSPQGSLAVEIAGLCLFGSGMVAMGLLLRRHRRKGARAPAARKAGAELPSAAET